MPWRCWSGGEGRETRMEEELHALAWEAARRKTSYGKLVAGLTKGERKQIVKDYRTAKKKENKGK